MTDDVRNADVTTAPSPRATPKSDAPLAVTILGAGRVVSDYYLPALRATRIASSVTIVDADGVLSLDTGRITLGPLPIALGQPGIIPPTSPVGCI